MKLPKVGSVKVYNNVDLSDAITFKKKQSELKECLQQIILQRQNTKREEVAMNKLEDNETVKHQTKLLDKLEMDQQNNMNTYVKYPQARLEGVNKPNYAIVVKNLDKQFNDYVEKQRK